MMHSEELAYIEFLYLFFIKPWGAQLWKFLKTITPSDLSTH